jgi:hypothetical protein
LYAIGTVHSAFLVEKWSLEKESILFCCLKTASVGKDMRSGEKEWRVVEKVSKRRRKYYFYIELKI